MASKLKVQELALQSPNGLQESTLSLSDSGVVSSTKPLTLASPTITGTIPQEAWIAPTLLNSWLNYSTSDEQCGYMKDNMGFVHLKGLVKSGTLNNAIFMLPVGYRPLLIKYFPTVANAAFGHMVVQPSGAVYQASGSTAWVSLDGITFKAEQ